MIKRSKVIFINDKLENNFNSLSDNDSLKKSIIKSIEKLKNNAFIGIQIPKKLIPKSYIKLYKINNLWKINLVSGWRLLYTISTDKKIELISAILEWSSHKNYEKKMNYKVKDNIQIYA